MAMASSLICPPTSHLLPPARARVPTSAAAIPPAAADPGKKASPSPSDAPLVQRVLISSGSPKRPWWAPLLLSAARRPGSDRAKPAEWAAPAPVKEGSGDGGEIGAERPAKGERPGERRRSALTAEKARVLRREMRATETWHDAMYHSAIASRLASPDEH